MIPNVKGGGLPSESIQAVTPPAQNAVAQDKPVSKPVITAEAYAAEKAVEAQKSSEANRSVSVGGTAQAMASLPKAEFSPRLTIEKLKTGGWIYKALDPITGDVINQFPREQLLKMKSSQSYQPGDVIKTQA